MEENNTRTEYRPAADFFPYHHANAVKGIAESLHWLLTEGPGTSMIWSHELRASVNGMVWAQQKLVRELHEWLVNIENLTTIELPIRAEDFEEHHVRNQKHDGVKDEPAIYAVK